MNEVLRLDTWKGDWGLPSVDFSCLHILAYAKFSGVPLKINPTNNPLLTPNGQLPVLNNNVDKLGTVEQIISFLKEQKYNPDDVLTPRECAEIEAYSALIKEQLFPALQYIWWIDLRNLDDLIRPWYVKALPFPLHFYYPKKYEQQAKDMMEVLYPLEDNLTVIEREMYSEAQECLTTLSTRLGTNEFFFGSHPSSLDAIVYSHLAPLLKAPFPNPALQNHLKGCTNLVTFVSRISQRYFAIEYTQYEKLKSNEKVKKKNNSEDEFPNKRRNQLLAGLVAIIAMVGYALSTGIVEVNLKDDDISDVDEDYLWNDEDDAES